MVRRNLIVLVFAIPVTAVPAAILLTGFDLRGGAAPQMKASVQPIANESVQPAVAGVATSQPALALDCDEQVQAGASSLSATHSVARHRTASDAASTYSAFDDAQGMESASIASDDVAASDSHHIVRRAASVGDRLTASTGKGDARRASVQARFAGSSRMPGSAASSAQRTAGLMSALGSTQLADGLMSAENGGFPEFQYEPLLISVIFGDAATGQPVSLSLELTNPEAQQEVFAYQVAIYAIADDGEVLGEVRPVNGGALIVDGESTATQDLWPLAPGDLLPWLKFTQVFDVVSTAVALTSGVEYAADNYLYMPVPGISVTLTPDWDVQAGDWVKVTIESDGPLGMALSNVTLRLNGGIQLLQPGQSISGDTASDVVLSLGDLAVGTNCFREEWFVAVDPEWALMCVQLQAEEILPQFGYAGLWSDSGAGEETILPEEGEPGIPEEGEWGIPEEGEPGLIRIQIQ